MTLARAIICLGLAAFAQTPGAASISAQDLAKVGTQSSWVEEKWPFPIDQWGIGQAFGCAAERCGRQLQSPGQDRILPMCDRRVQ